MTMDVTDWHFPHIGDVRSPVYYQDQLLPGDLPPTHAGDCVLWRATSVAYMSSKATLWMKAQHKGALRPSCIVRKNRQVPHTAQQVACHP